MSIQDNNHKTNVYRLAHNNDLESSTGFMAKCICGWQKEYNLKDYFSDNESTARKDAENAATQHLLETDIVRQYLSRVAAKAGRAKSPKKANSSRLNGKKGGRPMIPVDIDALIEDEIISTGD